MISIIWTLITWIISLVIARAIFTLGMIVVGSLVSLLIFMWIIRVIAQTFGTKIALYILGGTTIVGILGGLIWSWQTPAEPVNPTVYVYAKEAVRGNAFTSPMGIFGRRTKTITLIDIGVPAMGAPFGQDSKEYLHLLVADKSVTVINPQGTRTAIEGVVQTPEGWTVQQMMVKAGMAWCTGKQWRREEKEAKRSKRGLWAVYGSDFEPETLIEFEEQHNSFDLQTINLN